MAYVPRGALRGKKSKERFHIIEADQIAAADGDDIFILTQSGSSFQVESEAGATILEAKDDGEVGIGNLVVGSSAVIPYAHHTGILIADLTAAFADPATLNNGWVGIYKNDSDSKIYFVTVVGGAFYLEELTAAAAA